MESDERPFGMHNPEERLCEFCGNIFYAHHGLQRYCPDKFGRKDYCKYEQKKLVNEKKLADKVSELAKAGMKVNEVTPIEKNRQALKNIMGTDWEKTIDSNLLDNVGYDILQFDSRSAIPGTNKFLIHIGDYMLEWIGQEGIKLTFKITKK